MDVDKANVFALLQIDILCSDFIPKYRLPIDSLST